MKSNSVVFFLLKYSISARFYDPPTSIRYGLLCDGVVCIVAVVAAIDDLKTIYSGNLKIKRHKTVFDVNHRLNVNLMELFRYMGLMDVPWSFRMESLC